MDEEKLDETRMWIRNSCIIFVRTPESVNLVVDGYDTTRVALR